ncbi:methyltransferase domain-containing protein [Muricauda sp. JGD-17]|uniref:Methyltransferase domain-containing protein n=1 Tax=Flagellimonas ochracea TaxID=2696472 RepID=A0A964TAY1_9FLAO|nr:methyltransferase domain-containing protein [Allomuricauda ochracea]NAY90914.1 methyltransferase domain-containing protein [Allomuricauda ochracea]
MDFSNRSLVEEYLDDPNLEKESFRKAYLDINRCNTLLGGTAITLKAIKDLIECHPKKSYTIYDMGCGDGHLLREVAKKFKNTGITLNLVGFDLRDDVIQLARDSSQSYQSISFKKADILSLDEVPDCDILLCTLTMHHFEEKEILKFIEIFSELAKVGVIINDLQRSKSAYFLFHVFSLFFIKSTIAKRDGLISISKGFRKLELKRMADNLKNVHHTITWKWAFRYLWVMKPMQPN